ncbi:MAG: cellulase family glycosylhydrolase [Victivallales bacterium]|nr:cellulase family glycosylhydrolase [Victivallales bacterium]
MQHVQQNRRNCSFPHANLYWVLILLFILFLSANLSAAGISLSSKGLVEVEDLKFGIVHWDGKWKITSQLYKPDVLSYLGEGGEKTPAGILRNGSFSLFNGSTFNYAETINRKSDNEATFTLVLSSSTGIPSMLTTYITEIPVDVYKDNPAVFNGEKLTVEGKEKIWTGRKNGRLVLNLKRGTLVINGDFAVIIRLHPKKVEVRLRFNKGSGNVRRAQLKIHMNYIPLKTSAIDLNKAMNMGFRDEVANDQQGGWTDQGPSNDLSVIKSGEHTFAGVPFNITDPTHNNEKSCIAMKGTQRSHFLERATVDVPGLSGEYLYVLNGLAWAPPSGTVCGRVIVTYHDRTAKTFELKSGIDTGDFWNPIGLENAVVAWKHHNGSAEIGLYSTKIPLAQNKRVVRLEFVSANQVWMIVAASISDVLQSRAETKLVLRPGNAWLSCNFEFKTRKGSVSDFSIFADAPAGKYGFLKTVNGNFEFENRPGVPVRFWGTNLCFGSQYMSEDKTLMMLDDIAAMGYNAIRMHHFDWQLMAGSDNGKINSESIRKLDFLVAEAQTRGIYFTLDLFTYRNVKEVKKFGTLTPREYKTLCYFDEDVYQSLLTFAKNLFGHKNEFTGKMWKDDPSIVLVNLVNEGTLPVTTGRPTARIKPIIDANFANYARQNRISITTENREKHFNDFLASTGKNFFNRLKKDLNDFGVRIPFSDQNFARPAGDTRAIYDYVDSHFYWGHPTYIGKKSGQLPVYVPSNSAIMAAAGGLNSMFFSRIVGLPMTVTEWNYCHPNPHNMEGPILTAAYSALQGYNGLWQFAYSHSKNVGEKQLLKSYDHDSNPVMKHAMRAGMLLFLRGDVKTAETTIPLLWTDSEKLSLPRRLGLILKTGIVFSLNQADPAIKAIIALPGTATQSDSRRIIPTGNENQVLRQLIDMKLIKPDCIDFTRDIIRSETGEIEMSPRHTMLKVVNPFSEAFVMQEKTTSTGRFMKINNKLSFATFFAGSLDGSELGQSKRIIILHLTDFKNENTVFKDDSMSVLETYGTPDKYLIRRGQADISIKHPSARHLYACAANGERLREIPLQRSGDIISFSVDTASEQGGIFTYELVTE